MPLFSEHISNMYYSGSPSYSGVPYGTSYGSSPYGMSYSASYLNPGGSYSNHSSLAPYTRTLSSRWLGRSYSPILGTIAEKGTTSPVRINSPRRTHVTRTYTSHISIPTSYSPRPININTADIDVSRDKYRNRSTPSMSTGSPRWSPTSGRNKESSQICEKPKTAVDSTPGSPPQRPTIKRDRPVVRLHTIKRKDRDSPRQPVQNVSGEKDRSHIGLNNTEDSNKPGPKWRQRLADDLTYKNKKEKKTIGEMLVEKFTLKNKDDEDLENVKIENVDDKIKKEDVMSPSEIIAPIAKSKLTIRRCSMEQLAEQASLLDSLIRRENLSTATLDLIKSTTETGEKCEDVDQKKRKLADQPNPLQTTKSVHCFMSNPATKRKSLRKSTSGDNIRRLDRISELPQINNENQAIDEIKISLKTCNVKNIKSKPKIKQKITSSVDVPTPPSPLKFIVKDVTVEEKPLNKRKEVVYSSSIENNNTLNLNANQTKSIENEHRKSVKIKPKISTSMLEETVSPESDDGNFWGKLGKRETIYLINRKKEIDETNEQNKRSMFWFTEEREGELNNEQVSQKMSQCYGSTTETDTKNTKLKKVKENNESINMEQQASNASVCRKDNQLTIKDNDIITTSSINKNPREQDLHKIIPITIEPEEKNESIEITLKKNDTDAKEANDYSLCNTTSNTSNEFNLSTGSLNKTYLKEDITQGLVTSAFKGEDPHSIIHKEVCSSVQNKTEQVCYGNSDNSQIILDRHEVLEGGTKKDLQFVKEDSSPLKRESAKCDTVKVDVEKLPSVKKPISDVNAHQLFANKKPVKNVPAPKPLIATPRPLQKKAPQVLYSSTSSETSSSTESSEEEDNETSDSSTDSSACVNNADGRTSTGSNDSGFDSSAPGSPSGFSFVRKGAEPGSSSSASVPLSHTHDLQHHEPEQSTAYDLFKKTGKFTPPAKSIPRFRKYTIDDFHFIKVLGKGSFGKVMLAELRDTEYYYAVKCLKKDVVLEDDDVECTLIERKVLALGTNHPYLCHLFATFQTDSHLFFVMEYLNGGDLMFHIQQSGRFPEPRARFYAAEIISGLKFLHKRGIVYRDLKLDNILLDFEGHVRIADFGMCKLQIYLDKTADTFCGTPDYMAPEIIKGLKYNQTVDWWSFGVLLYEMLIGQSPFSGCDEDELFWSICNELPSFPRFLSADGLDILTRLLDKDARTRLGGPECEHGDVRDHPFFREVPWDRLERRDLPAPFKPRVRHPLDTQYFDRAFTCERPRLTAVEPHVLRSMDQGPFRGFSYTNPNASDR
ncbi:probable serine/threonine-protein kinase dyrk2 isoform X2 [Pieris rapae]|uniref:probable serine/threonine-protein kinase dyrk2 isoform X2 n=1 Tax=Pieris rapae TaxID=64459 RepID=UPI001E279F9A|nr:probable serine/threonine-protein kinase dyrk2 isoform X2 [Pieris rapae]